MKTITKKLKSGIEVKIGDDVIFLPFFNLYFDDIRELAGVINGQIKSERKSKTSAENGKKGGRPRKKVLPIQENW